MAPKLVFFPYYGGKSALASWLSRYVPDGGAPYCEPFAGSAGLFFKRPRAPIEVLNDIDEVLINVYRVVQSDDGTLQHMLRYTPYSRKELARAITLIKTFREGKYVDSVLLAWAKIVMHRLAFSGIEAATEGEWSRALDKGTKKGYEFFAFKKRYEQIKRRVAYVFLENMDGAECILKWDNPDAVFYVDPPYLWETRKSKRVYAHEMSAEEHKRLIDVLLACEGAVTLSGYPNAIYSVLEERGWIRFTKTTSCYAAGRHRKSKLRGDGSAIKFVPRVECVWVNPRAQNMLIQQGKSEMSVMF